MKSRKVLVFILLCVIPNLVLGMMVIGLRALRESDQSQWRRQSQLAVNWAERMAKEKRPIEEVHRFSGRSDRSGFTWGPHGVDIWTISFETDDAGKIVDVRIDGNSIEEFREIYPWLKE